MLRVVKHHDRPPDLFELVQVDLVQEVLLLEVPVGDPWILPAQGQHELHVDVRLDLLNVQNRLQSDAQEYLRLVVSFALYGRGGVVGEVGVVDRNDVAVGLVRAVRAVVLSIASERHGRVANFHTMKAV